MPDNSKSLKIDDSVIVAFMIGGRPMAIHCTVHAEAPTYLYTRDPRVSQISFPQSVIMVWHRDTQIMKGEANAISVQEFDGGFLMEVQHTMTREPDRRVYPRYPYEGAVSLRSVCDISGATVIALSQGITKDISEGGAWIEVSPVVPMGSIVECKIDLGNDDYVLALAIVAHENPNRGGNGMEFLELYGDSRDTLRSKLRRAA